MLRLIFVLVFLGPTSAVIYKLNESEYSRMPPLYELDDFHRCMVDPGAQYCLVDVGLHAAPSSDLMTLIQEYSEHKLKHFNHTELHRGICVTRTCKNFLRYEANATLDLNATLEACLNDSLWNEYQLQAKLVDINYCINEGEEMKLDISDAVMAVIYLVVFLFNAIGSFYDICLCEKDAKSGNQYLLAFSMRRNWARLTSPGGGDGEPRLQRLQLFHGLRVITMICVIFSHTSLIMCYSYLENPLYIETSYEDPMKQIIFNGSLVTYTFFVMSAFLLAYNFQLQAEKGPVSWWQLPKGMLMRWIRLTPVYAFVLGTVSTLMRHAGSGPLWRHVVVSEATACRHYWWAHLLYVNNYVYDDAFCAPQTWYLAADTQLFCAGLLVCVAARTARAQKAALLALFALALLAPALHTYLQDLDAVVIQSPEVYRNLYQHDATFRLLYARGHTNLSTYTLGLAGGFLAYYWQTEGRDFAKYKRWRWAWWLTFPSAVCVILSGGLFYTDGARAPLYARVLYAALYKPVFQALVVVFIIGCIFRFENLYRPVVEWRGWTWAGRVSYSAFLLHSVFQRALYGTQTTPLRMTEYNILIVLSATTLLSFVFAALLWLLVEAPAAQLTRAVLAPRRRHLGNNMAAAAAATAAVEAGDGHSKL